MDHLDKYVLVYGAAKNTQWSKLITLLFTIVRLQLFYVLKMIVCLKIIHK